MALSLSTTLQEIVAAGVNARLADCYHTLPGIVDTYYSDKQEADIRIGLTDPRFDPDTDERIDEEWKIYPRVRVAWPRFGGFTIMGPLSKGDKVEVFFQDLDDSAFRVNGEVSQPILTRRFDATSAFCVPWDITDPGVATDASAAGSALIIGKDGSDLQMQINGTTIDLGKGASDFVALASKVLTELSNIVTGFNSHTHVVAMAAPPANVISSTPASPLSSPSSVAASLVRAK